MGRLSEKLQLALAAALISGSVPAQETVIRLGHVAPMTGDQAIYGQDNANGALLAVEDLNASGITIGGNKVKFELINEDDAADPRQATAVAYKLVDARVHGVIGHLNSGTTIPASRIYHEAGIAQISASATNPKYTHQGYNTTFRLVASDGQLAGKLGRYAIDTLKARNIAVIDDRTTYGQGVASEFIRGARAALPGVQLSQEYTNDKATDFTVLLTRIKGRHLDVIFFGGTDNVGGPILRQMRQLGINATFMGSDAICTTGLPELAGDALQDGQVICLEAGVSGAAEKSMSQFTERYRKRFNTEVRQYAPYVYDAVMTMAAAMRKADSAEPAKYLPELARIRYDGITGPIAFDANGDIKDRAMVLSTYKGGRKEKIAVIR